MKKKSKVKKQVTPSKKTRDPIELPKLDKHQDIDEVVVAESVEELAEREADYEDDSESLEEDRY